MRDVWACRTDGDHAGRRHPWVAGRRLPQAHRPVTRRQSPRTIFPGAAAEPSRRSRQASGQGAARHNLRLGLSWGLAAVSPGVRPGGSCSCNSSSTLASSAGIGVPVSRDSETGTPICSDVRSNGVVSIGWIIPGMGTGANKCSGARVGNERWH